MVGNSPDALPPGLTLDVDPAPMVGRLPTGSGEVLLPAPPAPTPLAPDPLVPDPLVPDPLPPVPVVCVPALTVIGTDTAGLATRPLALAVAVSLTEVTDVAVAGTVTRALTSLADEAAKTVPRSHDAVRFGLQPKLNSGTRLVGAADSLIVAPGTSPFSAQALTIH
jgi:hypothetical protein